MQMLIDHNIEGFAPLLLGILAKEGWVELLQLSFIYFLETDLPAYSDDTTVRRYAQNQGAILLTSNRNCQDDTSLQAIIERENHPAALPVVTLSHPERYGFPPIACGWRSRLPKLLSTSITIAAQGVSLFRDRIRNRLSIMSSVSQTFLVLPPAS